MNVSENSNPSNELLEKAAKFIGENFLKYELICAAIMAAGFLLKYNAVAGGSPLLSLSAGALAVLYFIRSYTPINNESATNIDRFLYKLTYYSFSLVTVGVLFKIQHWPGSKPMLLAGAVSMLISAAIYLYSMNRENGIKYFNRTDLIRFVVILSIAALVYFTKGKNFAFNPNGDEINVKTPQIEATK